MGKQKIGIIIVVLFVTVSGIFYSVNYGKKEEAVFLTEEISGESAVEQNANFFEIDLKEDSFNKESTSNEKGSDKQNLEISFDKEEVLKGNEAIEEIYVHICGQVISPGVYCLKKGSRVNDLIELAKGFTEDASIDYVNLAQKLVDGEQIYIPSKKEVLEMDISFTSKITSSTGDNKENEFVQEYVNINTADKSKLMTLTGIGEAKAEAIIQYREEHGGFRSIEELKQIEGIKDGVFNKIKDKITVG